MIGINLGCPTFQPRKICGYSSHLDDHDSLISLLVCELSHRSTVCTQLDRHIWLSGKFVCSWRSVRCDPSQSTCARNETPQGGWHHATFGLRFDLVRSVVNFFFFFFFRRLATHERVVKVRLS
jgi:hypothetical protein